MINTPTRIAVMLDVMDTDGITDADRAAMGLQCLLAARELFNSASNYRTAARVASAISSARGAVRIQSYRETRRQHAA
jgi:hypothetical protein